MASGQTDISYDPKLRPVRQARQLGDWAALMAIALFIALCFAWPRVPQRAAEMNPLPEPSCAYVELATASFSPMAMARTAMASPGGLVSFGRGMGADGIFSDDGMPKLPNPPLPALPDALSVVSFAHPTPTYVFDGEKREALLVATDDCPYPYSSPSLAPTGLAVTVSEQLRDAGFEFDVPHDALTNAVTFSAYLAFSSDGKCVSLLFDNVPESSAGLLPWRTALMFSHTVTNASGTVVVRSPTPDNQKTGERK